MPGSALLDDYHFTLLVRADLVDELNSVDLAIQKVLSSRDVYRPDQYDILPPDRGKLYREALERARRHIKKRGGAMYILSRDALRLAIVQPPALRAHVYLRIMKLHEKAELKNAPAEIDFDPQSIT